MPSLTMAFGLLCLVFFTVWEIIEEIHLSVKSHSDGQRDFEGMNELINLAAYYGFKLLGPAVFLAFTLFTSWACYNLPLERSSRRNLEADRDNALSVIQQLLAKNSELQIVSDKTHEDRKSIQSDHDLLATQKCVLEKKLAQSKADLNAKCLELETSLEQSKMLRFDERKALSMKARRAKEELEVAKEELEHTKTVRKLQIQRLKVAHSEDLNKVKEQHNKAIAALSKRISNQLGKELDAQKDATTKLSATLEDQKTTLGAQLAQKSLEIQELKLHQSSKQGSNKAPEEAFYNEEASPVVSLAEIRTPSSLIAWPASSGCTPDDGVCHIAHQTSDQVKIKAHECDHSTCERQFLDDSNTISELRDTVLSLNSMLDARELDMSSSTAGSQEEASKAVLAVKAKEDQLQHQEKALEEEKAGREKAVEEKRRIAREGFLYSNTLRAEVESLKKGLRKALDDMTAGKAARQEVERQRDDLVKAVGQLEGRMSRMEEVDLMEGVEFEVEA